MIASANILKSITVMAVLAVSWACGDGNGTVNPASSADTVVLSPAERRMKDSLDSIAALPPDILRNHITTPEQADSFMRQSGHWEKYSQGVIDTIASQDMNYADKLLHNREPYFLVADKQRMMLVLYDKYGRAQGAFKMACSAHYGARHAYRDNRTPEGYYTAEGVHNSTEWLFTDDDGNTSEKRGQFGPRFIRLKESPMIGIHGTCAPWSRGHRASHGCMRLHNAHILYLASLVTPGTPIIISPSNRDQSVNRDEGYRITQLHLPLVEETAVDENYPGLQEYLEHEKLVQHQKDSIAAVMLARELRRQRADSIALAQQMADSVATLQEI